METQQLIEKISNCPYFQPNITRNDFVVSTSNIGDLIASGYYDMLWAEHSDHKVRFSNRLHGRIFLDCGRVAFRVSYTGASLISRYWDDLAIILENEPDKEYLYPEDVDIIYPELEEVPSRKHHFISCIFNGNFDHALKQLSLFEHEMYYDRKRLDKAMTNIVNHVTGELNELRPDHLQLQTTSRWQDYVGFNIENNPVKNHIRMINDDLMSYQHQRWMQIVTHYMNT